MNVRVCISTCQKYKTARDTLLTTLPLEWKNNHVSVYQGEPVQHIDYRIHPDGPIDVRIPQNLSDYGNWIGAHFLLEHGLVEKDAWFLFIHDTCVFTDESTLARVQKIIADNSHADIIWLCDTGRCNLCLIRGEGIVHGNERYFSLKSMTKPETIQYEWEHDHLLSPKSFPCRQVFLPDKAICKGKQFVYHKQYPRGVLYYPSVGLEKYYYDTDTGTDHPMAP